MTGLHVVRPPGSATTSNLFYVVFWPNDTTWNHDAAVSVQRERVVNMRYVIILVLLLLFPFLTSVGC